jgi:hypothetical protein
MSLQVVIKKSRQDYLRASFLQASVKSFSFLARLKYLLYRARYPVLTRVISRLFILLELYFAYLFFSQKIFTEIALFLILIQLQRAGVRGVLSSLRPKLAQAKIKKNDHDYRLAINKATTLGNTTGLLMGFLFAIFAVIQMHQSATGFFYLLYFLLLTPLYSITTILWGAIYVERRQYRSFTKVITLRAIPLLVLLSFSGVGPTAYLIGILVAKALEYVYLIGIALKALKLSISQVTSVASPARLKKFISNRFYQSITLSAVIFPLYDLLLGLVILNRSAAFFVVYCTFYFLIRFLLVIVLQTPRTLFFDVYTALKNGRPILANIRAEEIWQITLVLTFCLSVFITMAISSPDLIGILPDFLSEFWIYFILLFSLRGLAETGHGLAQVATTDYFAIKKLLIIVSLFLLIHFTASQLLVTNLQFFFFIEVICWAVVVLVFLDRSSFLKSSPYLKFFLRRNAHWPIVPPAIFQTVYAEALASGQQLYICEFDDRLNSKDAAGFVFRDHGDLIATPVLPGIYMVLTSSREFAPPFCKFIIRLTADSADHIADTLINFITKSSSRNKKVLKIRSYFVPTKNKKSLTVSEDKESLMVMLDSRSRAAFKASPIWAKCEQLKYAITFYRPTDDLIPVWSGLSFITISSQNRVILSQLPQDNLSSFSLLLKSYLMHYFESAFTGGSDPMQTLFGVADSRMYLRVKRRIRFANAH